MAAPLLLQLHEAASLAAGRLSVTSRSCSFLSFSRRWCAPQWRMHRDVTGTRVEDYFLVRPLRKTVLGALAPRF